MLKRDDRLSPERREKRLDISANIEGLLLLSVVTCTQRQHTTAVCRGGGLNQYQGFAADRLQRSLLRGEPPFAEAMMSRLRRILEASTLLTVCLGDRYPEVIATHCAPLHKAFAAREGYEVDTQGDSFFVVFLRATQAVAAAVAIRPALATEA